MIRINATGRLTKDVEIKKLEKDVVLNFTLASGKDDNAQFLECKFYTREDNKQIDLLTKGSLITIDGDYFTEKWEKDGKKYSKVICRVDKLFIEVFKRPNDEVETEEATEIEASK